MDCPAMCRCKAMSTSPENFDAWLKQYPPDVAEEAGLSLMYLI